MSYVTHALQ